jgi:mevalonate kinase
VAFVGSGWAKLLLFGEHAAVYGHPAVGLSLTPSLRAYLHPRGAGGWKIEGVREEDREPICRILDLLADLSGESSEHQWTGGELQLKSRIPRGLGFGSSASLCVALAAAAAAGVGETDSRRIWEWAHRAEALFHGTPSGIDTGLALLGGLYSFRPHPPGLPEAERLRGVPLYLVVGAVPRKAGSGALIGALREKVAARDQGVEAILERLGGLASAAAEILRSRPGQREQRSAALDLGALASEAHSILRSLDLSTPQLDDLLREGQAHGALGGKLSGAGGGGAFFLICPDAEAARGAAAALQRLCRSWRLATADTIYPLSWMPGRDG